MSSKNSELEDLFEFAPPQALRKSLYTLFFNYLDSVEEVPEDFQKMAQDIHALIKFLDNAAEEDR